MIKVIQDDGTYSQEYMKGGFVKQGRPQIWAVKWNDSPIGFPGAGETGLMPCNASKKHPEEYLSNLIITPPNTQLVGGFNPSEKYEFVNWDDDITEWDINPHVPVTTNQTTYFQLGYKSMPRI